MPFHRLLPLSPASIPSFTIAHFIPSVPCLLPPSLLPLPATTTWFLPDDDDAPLPNHDHFSALLGPHFNSLVPIETTDRTTGKFERTQLPFNLFLQYLSLESTMLPKLYLAQTELLMQFPQLMGDVPTPEVVKKAGRGDVYAVNLWIGKAGETNTPLHKDPNPNVFAQLSGRKKLRLFHPDAGYTIMERYGGWGSRERKKLEVGKETWAGMGSGLVKADRKFRGEEMMMGFVREQLDSVVWGNLEEDEVEGFEAEVGVGEGVFIPMGWWHAVRSMGERGVSASVNWWFR